MEDILIYPETEEVYTKIVLEVRWKLNENCHAIVPDNRLWHSSRGKFVGYILLLEGIQMALDKIKTIPE